MENKVFIPFSDIQQYRGVLVVDSYHPRGFVLSHWRGAPKLPQLHDDTSTGIVLNALKADLPQLHTHRYVTNNHFDIDGFLGIWSLMNPALALAHEELLRKMALMGDFREMQLEIEEDHLALKLVCWINTVERNRFYAPFASYAPRQSEVKQCVDKYLYFLEAFGNVLQHPDTYYNNWVLEYEQVVRDWQIIQSSRSAVSLEKDIRLLVVETPEPLHYYALFGLSNTADAVLCLYSGNRFELEYKYTSWIDTATRFSFPRLDLQPLVEELNQLESSPYRWNADKITDTGPILRLQEKALTKEERYDHPANRNILPSGISAEKFKEIVFRFFKTYWPHLPQKTAWSWPEIREINRQCFENKKRVTFGTPQSHAAPAHDKQ